MRYITILSWIMILQLWSGCSGESENNSDSAQNQPDTLIQETVVKPDSIPLYYLLGRFEPAQDTHFVQIKNIHANGSAVGSYLRKEAYAAFQRMHKAALQDGHELMIISATRNFDQQKAIWEAKWRGERKVEDLNLATDIQDPQERALKILRYSSMPGTSRHHWGTDMDINSLSNSYFEGGDGKQLYQWMQQHAASYGFCQPYMDKSIDNRTGYEEEKWHWSYAPLAQKFTLAYETYISEQDINGFEGSRVVDSLNIISHYVLGIHESCMQIDD